jgi:hypothetical protein
MCSIRLARANEYIRRRAIQERYRKERCPIEFCVKKSIAIQNSDQGIKPPVVVVIIDDDDATATNDDCEQRSTTATTNEPGAIRNKLYLSCTNDFDRIIQSFGI